MSGTVGNILRWFAAIGAAFKKPAEDSSRPGRPASEITDEARAGSVAEDATAVATASERPVATATAAAALIADVAGDAKIGPDASAGHLAAVSPDQEEIQRRRELVRMLFNDFWSGCDDKPAAFVDRLDQAETYLNERLSACGELWQLDARTRKMLSLPARSNPRRAGNGAAHP